MWLGWAFVIFLLSMFIATPIGVAIVETRKDTVTKRTHHKDSIVKVICSDANYGEYKRGDIGKTYGEFKFIGDNEYVNVHFPMHEVLISLSNLKWIAYIDKYAKPYVTHSYDDESRMTLYIRDEEA